MLTQIHPKLPMRNKEITKRYYCDRLGFKDIGTADFPEYLILSKDLVEIHFFLHSSLAPSDNYGQVYIRCKEIDALYKSLLEKGVAVHPNGKLSAKQWGQKEFSLLDPDSNLLTFGAAL